MSVQLAPSPVFSWFTTDGKPAVGYQLGTYVAGTSTPQASYVDSTQTTPNTNPVILNAAGYANVWLVQGQTYKLILSDPNGNTVWSVDQVTGGLALTQQSLGQILWPRTDQEIAASVIPPNFGYPPDDVRRIGVIGNGVIDDTTAWANVMLVAAQGQQYKGQLSAVYVLSSAVAMGARFVFDGNGAMFKATITAGRIVSTNNVLPGATAVTTVSSGATQGSRTVVVAVGTGLLIGQWVRIWDASQNYPAYWGTITNISGTTIGLDRSMPLTYAGSTINFLAFNTNLIQDTVDIKNVVFDGTNVSGSPGNDGSAIRIIGYEFVRFTNVRVQNFNGSVGANVLHGEDNISWNIDGCYSKNCSTPNAVGTYYTARSRKATFTRCHLEADLFGLNADWCEDAVFTGNSCSGRTAFETGTGITPGRSVRGLKANACGFFNMTGNIVSDYSSPIRGSIVHRFNVTGNTVRNAGLEAYSGQIALNISNAAFVEEMYGVVADNLVENCGGIAIAVDDGNAGTTDSGAEVTGNVINGCQGIGIYLPIAKASVHNNKIFNWNQRAAATDAGAAIYYNAGLNATGNEFKNSTNTYPCFRNNFVSGQIYWLSGNFSPTGNPTYSGGTVDWATQGTANLGAAATTITFNHNCVVTPKAGDVLLSLGNLPTAAIGELCLTAVSATQITVVTRAAPGASTLNIAWSVRITVPHTAP